MTNGTVEPVARVRGDAFAAGARAMLPWLVGAVVRRLDDRATRRAALTAAAVAVVASSAPLHLGVVLGIVTGLIAGATVRERNG